MQHEKNLSAIDTEIDSEIKKAGGLNISLDISTPNKTVSKEKNIVVKLYLTKAASAKEKTSTAKTLFAGDVLDSSSYRGSTFAKAQSGAVQVDQIRLANWANAYQAARLALIYTEMAQRLKQRADALTIIETAQITRAKDELKAANEKIGAGQYPLAPPGVSVESNMEESLTQREYFKNGGSAFLFSWFYKKVRNRGDWDYKQHAREYATFGNFNYGAAGTAAGITETVLLRAAGAAQTVAGTSQSEFDQWWSEAPYGDDPVDQAWIKAGIDYAKSKGY